MSLSNLEKNLKHLYFYEILVLNNSIFCHQRLYFKLRRMTPCALCDLNFKVNAPEEDELEVVVTGVCVALDDSQSQNNSLNEGVVPGSAVKPLLKPGVLFFNKYSN